MADASLKALEVKKTEHQNVINMLMPPACCWRTTLRTAQSVASLGFWSRRDTRPYLLNKIYRIFFQKKTIENSIEILSNFRTVLYKGSVVLVLYNFYIILQNFSIEFLKNNSIKFYTDSI